MVSENASDLYKDLSAKHGWPESRYLPIIFRRLATLEQAKILLQFPATAEQIVEKLAMDRNTVDKHLQELFEKGLAFPSKKGWRLNRIMDSLHDLTLINKKYWDSYGGREFADLWVAFEKLEWFPEFVRGVKNLVEPHMRVVPAWEAIRDNPDRLPSEDMREIYRAADLIVEVPCCCRLENPERDCGTPEGMCIALNRSARYNLDRGVGRKLSLQEALGLEAEARNHNLITQVPNNAVTSEIICHCDACCCLDFVAFKQEGESINDFKAKSRYIAVIDPEKCIGCQTCMDACQFEALELKRFPGMKKWKAHADDHRCMGCGNCAVKCTKEGAITLKLVRPPEHIPGGEVTTVYSRQHKSA